ncbi:hypothetical protein FRB96_004039 [Tulasnella sp. 330]|nr:hypothetical protein FRB96_004039 [Tulasnella sp. 330]KAG8871082.1 hypothetical protein FRB98_001059 [Tulasnella sp. 332]KAG8871199.1 hypothetical protein FRB97_008910 [Tulasnella sp. 331]
MEGVCQPSPPPSPQATPQPPIPILVAPRFEDAKIEHLVALISDMIDRLIVHNDQIPLQSDGLTRFHSRSPPSISVRDYLARIVRYANVEKSCLLITLHYIDQICARLPKFTITSLTIHRFVIASVTVSSKALCDVFCTNSRYAQVGGIKTNELNLLEREFLNIIDWRLFCTGELLQQYYANLVRTHSKGAYKLDIPPDPEPISPFPIPASLDETEEMEAVASSSSHYDADEAESTATEHFISSCAASIADTAAGDGDMRSDVDFDDEVVIDDGDAATAEGSTIPPEDIVPEAVVAPSSISVATPRTAAKRRAESAEVNPLDERLRPRGRRRLDRPM